MQQIKKIQDQLSWPFALTILVFVGVVVLYWPAINEFIYDWSNDDNYSHGFLIPFISAYLLWQKKDELISVEKKVQPLGLLFLLSGLGLNILGTAAAEWFTLRFSLILVLLGIVIFLWGFKLFAKVWFPIVFLAFSIPLPYTLFRTLTFPLQLFSTKVTAAIISGLGVPLLREGNIIHVPGYSLEVVEACSGMRSIITLSALSAVFANMSSGGSVRKIFVFFLAVPIAVIANVFRLLITTIGAMVVSPSFAKGFLHDFSGMLVFIIGLTFFFMVNWLMSKIFPEKSSIIAA